MFIGKIYLLILIFFIVKGKQIGSWLKWE